MPWWAGFRGGPAKAAVLASGLTGMVSGSSIANVATTGTFTIPLMKRVGLPAYKAGAVEVGASTNGQLLPPVMGAAAFIMAEFLGLPYIDVVTAAAIPAVLSYIALIYVVHLEALKLNLTAIPAEELPPFWTTFLKGVHFLIPILALIYTLVILRFSAISAAFNAILLTLAIMVIQRSGPELRGSASTLSGQPGTRIARACDIARTVLERPRDPAGLRVRRPKHGTHRGGHRGGGYHRGHRDPHGPQQSVHRGHRDHLPGATSCSC